MNAEAEYLCGSVSWSVLWFVAGVLCTLAAQAVLRAARNLWRQK